MDTKKRIRSIDITVTISATLKEIFFSDAIIEYIGDFLPCPS